MNSFLDSPLPADAVPGMTWGPLSYRKYPVFSRPWLQKRLVASLIAIVLYAALSALGQTAAGNTWANALVIASYFTAGALLMFTIGPALAAWVRHRGFSRRVEAWGVIIAVSLGFVAGMAADAWASGSMKEPMRVQEVPQAERKIGELDEATLRLAQTAGVFLYFTCGGGLAALAYFSERRRLLARSQHLARLDSDMRLTLLQAQIEPHFLFNTLASIRPLIRQDAARAESALDALAAHLRAVIPQIRQSSQGLTSTLGQQVEICASYLELLHLRMGGRLKTDMDVPPGLHTLAFPPLMLLSLVENAIKHGIEPRPGPGHLVILARQTGDVLEVSVSDDGAGLKDGLHSGLGLANIREQLAMRYPGGPARLTIAARPEGGTVASIILPASAAPAPPPAA